MKRNQEKTKIKKEKRPLRRAVKVLLIVALILGFLGAVLLLILNAIVTERGKERILSPEKASVLTDVDCVLVLGCQVKSDGTPSYMLYDRVMQGVELYKAGVAPVLFMTGDSRNEGYDEVGTMKALAVEAGVPEEAVVTDPYGLSTYDSVLRAKEIFGYDNIVIVTQEYHLYRAVYIAGENAVEAHGVPSDPRSYGGQIFREIREILARAKDVFFCLADPEPEMGYTLPEGYQMGRE